MICFRQEFDRAVIHGKASSTGTETSGERAYFVLAIPITASSRLHETFIDGYNSGIWLDARLVQQRFRGRRRTDRIQMTESVHHELDGGSFREEQFASLVG